MYRHGGFDEELIVPVIISTLGEGPICNTKGSKCVMVNGLYAFLWSIGCEFSIRGVDDIIQTQNAEILVSLGQPPGFALAHRILCVSSLRTMTTQSGQHPWVQVAGTLSGEATSDALWTVTAVATDQDLELAAYAFLGETFLLDGLVDGEYEVQHGSMKTKMGCWMRTRFAWVMTRAWIP